MITAFVALLVVVQIWFSGFFASMAVYERSQSMRVVSLVLLAFGAFGIYALIVGK